MQVLAAGNQQAVAVAAAAGLQFVRAECFVYSHVADEGWLDASAGPLLRYRRQIGADDVSIWCDVKKKHRCVMGESQCEVEVEVGRQVWRWSVGLEGRV